MKQIVYFLKLLVVVCLEPERLCSETLTICVNIKVVEYPQLLIASLDNIATLDLSELRFEDWLGFSSLWTICLDLEVEKNFIGNY